MHLVGKILAARFTGTFSFDIMQNSMEAFSSFYGMIRLANKSFGDLEILKRADRSGDHP
jgi:hypothetical protein